MVRTFAPIALALTLIAAAPVKPATAVPEPTDVVLFLLGAAGVVIGRKLQHRKRD